MVSTHQLWMEAMGETISSYRRMIDGCVAQLSDSELHQRPTEGVNSVAIVLRHLGGNLRSRWTDFLTTDGEKPDRDRETEFAAWTGDRALLMQFFDTGWAALVAATTAVNESNISQQILIRGEAHSIPQAFDRSITHIAYHAGQIALISRMVHDGNWQWLTVEPGGSQRHNEQTWGTAASRSVFGQSSDD